MNTDTKIKLSLDDPNWYTKHDNLVVLTAWLADNHGDPKEVASAVEKPWKYEAEFDLAAGILNADEDEALIDAAWDRYFAEVQ